MGVKPGYKETEVGVIPEDWIVESGLDVTTLIGKGGSPRWQGFNYSDIGMLFITSENVRDGFLDISKPKYLPLAFHEKLRRTKLQKGDILINLVGASIGRSCEVKIELGEANVNQAVAVFRVKEQYWTSFIAYYFQAPATIERILDMQVDAARPNVSLSDLRGFMIPLPPFPEQQAIAEALNDTDELIHSLDQLIAKKQDLKQAAMQQLLTGKTRLPGFSGKWDYQTFGQIFNFQSTATNSRADLSESGDAYYVHYGDIHTRIHNHLDFRRDELPRIWHSHCKNAATIQNCDWIMVDASEDYTGVGKSVEVSGLKPDMQAVAGLHTYLLREKKPTYEPGFKGHLGNLKSLHSEFLRVATGLKVYGVSKTALRDLLLPIPRSAEQTAIACVLSDMDAELTTLEAKRDKTIALKQGMMQELLTGRTRLI